MRRLVLPFACLACLTTSLSAQAQIYSWRDANGVQVFSDRPRTEPPVQAGRFDDIIKRYAAGTGISPDLIKAVIQVESGFDPAAVSPKGAQGLMQLMPATARELGVLDAFHPEENIRGGVAYLKQLLDQYGQDVRLALAAYNAGPASVARYGDIPPYLETQAYVRKVTSRTGSLPFSGAQPVAAPGLQMYKWVEVIHGRSVPRYSNVPPAGRPFEPVDLGWSRTTSGRELARPR